MLPGSPECAPRSQLQAENGLLPNAPHQVSLCFDDVIVFVDGEHRGRRTDEVRDRNASSVCEHHHGVACDALAEIAEHRTLVGSLLQAP